MAQATWSDAEVLCLIDIWADEEVQSLLESSRRNASIFERISREMNEAGYNKSATQCKEKLKKLRTKYKKLKDGHDISGTNRDNWPFYEKMDEVLGSRHSVQPPVTIDTSGGTRGNHQYNEEDGGDVDLQGHVDDELNITPTTPTATDNPSMPTSTSTSTTPASTTSTSVPGTSSRVLPKRKSPKKGKSPKKAKRPKKIDVMDRTLMKIAEIQEESDDRFLALEEKRMKMEEKMLSALQGSLNFMQQAMLPVYSMPYGGGYFPPTNPLVPRSSSSTTYHDMEKHDDNAS